ncbi:MAG TPA: AarF/ABC1/UbiB kinase family protein [Myxococcaceae bacterium]|nr:AarF/ABC1/UbiB kinase family protein [Myxococcaceae bacterium]
MIRETIQDLNRLRQIAGIAARFGFGEIIERSNIKLPGGRKQEPVELSPEAQRASTAQRFRLLLNALGPTFVKLGQILSTRADLLPAEFIEELSVLQDQVEPIPLEAIHEQIREALGAPAEELFASIDPTPLAAASIAQVHRATTREGRQVVVKVQRPGIAEQIRGDLSLLHTLAQMLEAVIEETGVYTPSGIIEAFDRAIHEELDFLNEAANIEAFQATHRDRAVVIPGVERALTARTVLTMEYVEGVKIHQVERTEEERHALAHVLLEESFCQLFEDGLFHGDPHPGNFLVRPDNRVVLLDFGTVGRLTPAMQETLVSLVLAIALKDADTVARLIYRVGVPHGRANLMAFRNDIEALLTRYLPTTIGEVNAQNLLRELLNLAVTYRIRVPKEYALLSRSSVAMEGILRSLAPELNIGEVALPYAKRLLAGRYDPTQMQGGMMRSLLRLQSMATEVPVQLSQVLMDLEAGKFNVQVRGEALDALTQAIRGAAVIGFLGLAACACIIGAFISFAESDATLWGMPLLGVVGITGAGTLFGAVVAWYLVGPRVRKVRISNWLKKR